MRQCHSSSSFGCCCGGGGAAAGRSFKSWGHGVVAGRITSALTTTITIKGSSGNNVVSTSLSSCCCWRSEMPATTATESLSSLIGCAQRERERARRLLLPDRAIMGGRAIAIVTSRVYTFCVCLWQMRIFVSWTALIVGLQRQT